MKISDENSAYSYVSNDRVTDFCMCFTHKDRQGIFCDVSAFLPLLVLKL